MYQNNNDGPRRLLLIHLFQYLGFCTDHEGVAPHECIDEFFPCRGKQTLDGSP